MTMNRMMNGITNGLLFAIGILFLSGCGHVHNYSEATCTKPSLCISCGEEKEKARGHSWNEANCTMPRSCVICGSVSEETPGHKFSEATCVKAPKCTVCGKVDGEALGHTTDNGICERCGEKQKKTWSGHKGGNPIVYQSGICRRHGWDTTLEEYNYNKCGDVYVTYGNDEYSFTKATSEDKLPKQFDAYFVVDEDTVFYLCILEESDEGIEIATVWENSEGYKLHYVNPLDYMIEHGWFEEYGVTDIQWIFF